MADKLMCVSNITVKLHFDRFQLVVETFGYLNLLTEPTKQILIKSPLGC